MSHHSPVVLTNTSHETAVETRSGAVWRHDLPQRDLDVNIVALPPGGQIHRHTGPDIDVVIHVLHGSGVLHSAEVATDLTVGDLVWLPRGTDREFTAGERGLRYLTVHQRRHPVLSIGRRPSS